MAGCAVSASGIATIGNDAAMTTLRIFPIVHSPVRRTDEASFGGFDNRGVANPGKLFSCRAHCYPAVADRRKLSVLSRDSFRGNVAARLWANPAARSEECRVGREGVRTCRYRG